MPLLPYMETLVTAQGDGSALTAAARNSMIPAAAVFTLPANFFDVVGKQLLLKASGRISNVVTTPGTARFDINFQDSAATDVIVFDSLAINLNTTAKTNVGWMLEILLTCRVIGTTGNLMGQGWWQSESVIGSPAVTAGGNGAVMIPYNTAPVVGANFNTTLSQKVDLRFTQTVATGSITLHEYSLIRLN